MKGRESVSLAEARGSIPLRVGLVAVMTLLVTLLYSSAAWARTFTVAHNANGGVGSLREAITKANSRAGADNIVFADRVGTITLGSRLIVTGPAGLSVYGDGDVTVSGNDAVHVFEVRGGAKLGLHNMTVANGRATEGFSKEGGGIYNSGALALTKVTLRGNHSTYYEGGGAISNYGTAKVTNSTISGNRANGVGQSGSGGGIANLGTLEVTNSTISGNSANVGGGIGNCGGDVTLVNSTIAGNRASPAAGGSGGGIATNNPGICNSSEGTMTLGSTIVAKNPEGGNCNGGPFTDAGFNIENGGSCGFTRATGSLPYTDPLLDPDGLQNNGGLTKTIALHPDSPAVDLVGGNACPPPTIDQRGVERPQGASCDSGAYERVQ